MRLLPSPPPLYCPSTSPIRRRVVSRSSTVLRRSPCPSSQAQGLGVANLDKYCNWQWPRQLHGVWFQLKEEDLICASGHHSTSGLLAPAAALTRMISLGAYTCSRFDEAAYDPTNLENDTQLSAFNDTPPPACTTLRDLFGPSIITCMHNM